MSDQIIDTSQTVLQEENPVQQPGLARKLDQKNDDGMAPLKGTGLTSIDMLMDVMLQLTVELGRTQMSVRQVLDMQKGSVVELNKIAGDSVDIFVNEHLIAKGEVVVVDDKFGVRIIELVAPDKDNGDN
jgi:flagellar motor switch protein FliN/FliY